MMTSQRLKVSAAGNGSAFRFAEQALDTCHSEHELNEQGPLVRRALSSSSGCGGGKGMTFGRFLFIPSHPPHPQDETAPMQTAVASNEVAPERAALQEWNLSESVSIPDLSVLEQQPDQF